MKTLPAKRTSVDLRVRCLPTAYSLPIHPNGTSARPVSKSSSFQATPLQVPTKGRPLEFWRQRNDRFGSRLCENSKTLGRDRTSCSSGALLSGHTASLFKFSIETSFSLRFDLLSFHTAWAPSRRSPKRQGCPQSWGRAVESDVDFDDLGRSHVRTGASVLVGAKARTASRVI